MLIGGIQKFTLIDYPGKISAAIFTMGCNFRCPYCHNPEIVDPRKIDYYNEIDEKDVLDFLGSRKGDLEGVCITGGEPTLQVGLEKFIKKIKRLGFSIKLDTNASHFSVVKSLVRNNLVDYWAVDIKTSPKKYQILTQKDDVVEDIERSLSVIAESEAELELRTTVVPTVVNMEDFNDITNWINKLGIFSKLSRYSIQNFRPEKTLRSEFGSISPYTKDELEKIAEKVRRYCKNVVVLD